MVHTDQSLYSHDFDWHRVCTDRICQDERTRTEVAINVALARHSVEETPPCAETGSTSNLRSKNRSETNVRIIPHVDLPPPMPQARRRASFHATQEWEGYVVEIYEDEFVARLVDLTACHTHESVEATIPFEEISERDLSRMALGRIFRWVIGHERSPEGTKKRVSQFVFRDLPKVTEANLRQGREWAKGLLNAWNTQTKRDDRSKR